MYRIRFVKISYICSYFLNHSAIVDIDADASEESQADVFLGEISVLGCPENVFPRHKIQQKQHRSTSQVVLQLQVNLYIITFLNLQHNFSSENQSLQ